MSLLSLLATIIAIAVAIPIAVFVLECLTAAVTSASFNHKQVSKPTLKNISHKILIPAHNEAPVIAETLQGLLAQGQRPDDILVIADNCEDETAAIVREHSIPVLERHDPVNRGKGFALDAGLRHIADTPPDVVLFFDADCLLTDGTIDQLVTATHQSKRPTQAIYLLNTPPTPSTKDRVSAFAFRVKNLVRPSGLHRLGQPCLLTGTGMGFPWQVIHNAPLASGNIVEDMQLGLDLALAGHAPLLVPHVRVTSQLPQSTAAATTQRTRWEHGHLQTLSTQVPILLKSAISHKRPDLLWLALDLFVPPLALLVTIWGMTGVILLLFGIIGGSWIPATIIAISGGLLIIAIAISWGRFGRDIISLSTLLKFPLYIAWKIPMYLGFFTNKKQASWVRTERDGWNSTRTDS